MYHNRGMVDDGCGLGPFCAVEEAVDEFYMDFSRILQAVPSK